MDKSTPSRLPNGINGGRKVAYDTLSNYFYVTTRPAYARSRRSPSPIPFLSTFPGRCSGRRRRGSPAAPASATRLPPPPSSPTGTPTPPPRPSRKAAHPPPPPSRVSISRPPLGPPTIRSPEPSACEPALPSPFPSPILVVFVAWFSLKKVGIFCGVEVWIFASLAEIW